MQLKITVRAQNQGIKYFIALSKSLSVFRLCLFQLGTNYRSQFVNISPRDASPKSTQKGDIYFPDPNINHILIIHFDILTAIYDCSWYLKSYIYYYFTTIGSEIILTLQILISFWR